MRRHMKHSGQLWIFDPRCSGKLFPQTPLPYRSSVVVFFACGHPASGMSVTLLSVTDVKVKSYVYSFFFPLSVPGES